MQLSFDTLFKDSFYLLQLLSIELKTERAPSHKFTKTSESRTNQRQTREDRTHQCETGEDIELLK